MIYFNRVTIIGVGLIGGSLARVLKSKNLAGRIIGAGRSRSTLEQALKLGVIDSMGHGSTDAVADADLVVLASPVGTFEKIVREIGPCLKPGAILTDVGSVKGALIKSMEAAIPPGSHYVPAHPIAGRERSGVAESTEMLFLGRRCVLTPTARTDGKALNAVRDMWKAAGANITIMDADLHDRVFAAVSHLPHVAAFAMMSAVSELNTGTEDYLQFSGAGFKDFTRIAASSPEMWKDICLLNRDNLVQMIDRYLFSLNRFKHAIMARDGKRLEMDLTRSSNVRRGME
ncbi:MAG TPA: prephenate dehydrogenase/arogenate dehydrogenase family protein [Nitrospirota bacterium]|nr:prephenate dehydrogenase/arogenate dehydrogenase family protein [Nitrospirota bacterium]